jgi:hypothetical protein
MAEYRVRIGEFRVYVKVLNLPFKVPAKKNQINSGAYGIILEKNVAS